MTFNSAVFFAFLLAFLPPYFALPSWRAKKIWLLVGGIVFYGWFNPAYLGLVFLSTTIDFVCVRIISSSASERTRKLAVTTSIVSNLTILATFKYFNFFTSSVAGALHSLGVHVSAPTLALVLPIGVSFYSFEAISYAVDAYKKRTTVARSYLDLLLFITFFPHLVAGPIVRARDFLPQLESPRKITGDGVVQALQWIIVGYFLKVGIADNLSSSVEHVFGAPRSASTSEAWLGTVYFSAQIFCDFAGYTSIARGLAKLMGFDLTPNFDYPYLARGFSDFWKRWHISLSSWLRDYLYIPLGGSRGGRTGTYRNLMITMLLGGLWHGAAWTFVAWGALHGTYLVVEHALRARWGAPKRQVEGQSHKAALVPDVAHIVATFLLVLVAWVFFRAASVADALALLRSMFLPSALRLTVPAKTMLKDGIWLVPMAVYFLLGYLQDRGVKVALSPVRRGVALGVLAFFTLVCREVSDAFIYFQF
jgi:alginate O-acetyltransferase complex protein AlgI